SMPEVSGDAALLIDPNKIVDIEKALAKVLANKRLREKMSKAGISQAKKFTWAKAAKETIKVYQDIGKRKEKKVKEKKK
ncbi:glycosyltransferase family 1 protein, partial [Patescibacteria group bacterium]|nr:glycosyltransferase family 1 protein [Patescibacteria group bacterium]